MSNGPTGEHIHSYESVDDNQLNLFYFRRVIWDVELTYSDDVSGFPSVQSSRACAASHPSTTLPEVTTPTTSTTSTSSTTAAHTTASSAGFLMTKLLLADFFQIMSFLKSTEMKKPALVDKTACPLGLTRPQLPVNGRVVVVSV